MPALPHPLVVDAIYSALLALVVSHFADARVAMESGYCKSSHSERALNAARYSNWNLRSPDSKRILPDRSGILCTRWARLG